VFCRFVVVGRCILIDFDRYSSTQSHAPHDGYINVRNMLST